MTPPPSPEVPAEPRPPRDRSVDVLKGLGITLVILGHLDASRIGGGFITYLYMFHVPLFFFASGYTWHPKPNVSWWKTVVTRFRQIGIPYLVLFAVSLFFGHVVMRLVFRQYVIPFELRPTVKAVLFSSEWLNTVPTFNFALWFLPLFLVVSIAFSLLQLIRYLPAYLAAVAALAVVSIPFQELVPGRPILAINVVPVGLVFMACGFLVKRYLPAVRVGFFAAAPIFAFTLWAALTHPGNVAAIGSYWYFPSALASALLYRRLAQDLESSSILGFIGRNSLLVYGLHGLVAATYPYTHLDAFFATRWDGLALYLLNAVYVGIGSVAIVKIYRSMRVRVDTVQWHSRRPATT
ncbi:MAG: acyltransferase family protein [Demequinaceae bacterium]|nr:acyltransferase family protein [Demequinaceae bacterium]